MATYRLKSSPAASAPGLIRWAINGYAFPEDQKILLNIVCVAFPSIPAEAIEQLLSKAVPFSVEEETETLVFEVEGIPPALPQLACRKCNATNPLIYFAPVTVDATGTCICFNCAKANGWLDADGNLRPGITL